jgi:hypothetical protein
MTWVFKETWRSNTEDKGTKKTAVLGALTFQHQPEPREQWEPSKRALQLQ